MVEVSDEMVSAGLLLYSEGGCIGLADYERREVVRDILEAGLAALSVPAPSGGGVDWIKECTAKISNAIGGGSELFVRHGEEYRLDVDFVCKRISEMRERYHDAMFRAVKAERATPTKPDEDRMRERVAELEKALEPFALISSEGLCADDVYTTVTTVSEYFHAASRALANTSEAP